MVLFCVSFRLVTLNPITIATTAFFKSWVDFGTLLQMSMNDQAIVELEASLAASHLREERFIPFFKGIMSCMHLDLTHNTKALLGSSAKKSVFLSIDSLTIFTFPACAEFNPIFVSDTLLPAYPLLLQIHLLQPEPLHISHSSISRRASAGARRSRQVQYALRDIVPVPTRPIRRESFAREDCKFQWHASERNAYTEVYAHVLIMHTCRTGCIVIRAKRLKIYHASWSAAKRPYSRNSSLLKQTKKRSRTCMKRCLCCHGAFKRSNSNAIALRLTSRRL